MLVLPDTFKIKPNYDLKLDQAQTLVDFETLLAGLGLVYSLQCTRCYPRTDLRGKIVEATMDKADGIVKLLLECDCSKHEYRGRDLVLARAPEHDVNPRTITTEKLQRPLTRQEMFLFDTADQLLHRMLNMRYWMRCLRCRNEDQSDGVWGRTESTATTYVVECGCTHREYRGADAPVPVQ